MSYIKKNNVFNDKCTDPKVYCIVLNNFLNNIKIPSIPPYLRIFIPNETIANTVEKANIFNESFASQCTPFGNSSKFPTFI